MKNGKGVAENIFFKSRKAYLKGHNKRATMWRYLLRLLCSCDLYPETQIDDSVRFVHNGLGCVISPDTIIEQGCMIFQNVTCGGNPKCNEFGEVYNSGGPHLEKDVIVYACAVIAGPVKIGGLIIGANAVVTRDVPPGSRIVGWKG